MIMVNTKSTAATAMLSDTMNTGPHKPSSTPAYYELRGRGDKIIEIYGALIGFASSKRNDHTHLPIDPVTNSPTYADTSQRCSACRWFEIRIFLVHNQYGEECTCGSQTDLHQVACGEIPVDGKYLILTYGITIVPNEETKRRASWTDSPYEIVELLTQSGSNGPFMPATSKRAFAQGAAFDSGMRDVYTQLIMPRVFSPGNGTAASIAATLTAASAPTHTVGFTTAAQKSSAA